jgi:hypothetical protein
VGIGAPALAVELHDILPEAGLKMRTSHFSTFLVVSVFIGSTTVSASPDNRPTPQRVAQLITQLGSNKFREREAASAALDAMGQPALCSLQKAIRDRDPEVSRRAEILANRIQRRVQTAHLLAPMRIRLLFDNTPVTEAVAELAKKSGYHIELRDSEPSSRSKIGWETELREPTLRLLDPRITLDTGETTFWEAMDLLCRRVGLVEKTGANLAHAANVSGGGVPWLAPSPAFNGLAGSAGRFVLAPGEGKPVDFPTCYTGSVRIRARSMNSAVSNNQRPRGEALVVLEVTPEPKMGWQGVVDLRVEKALDEQGRPVGVQTQDAQDMLGLMSARIFAANGAIVWDVDGRSQFPDFGSIPLRFKIGNRRVNAIKEVSGVISACVFTPTEPLVTVEGVLKSAGQTCQGPNGESLKLVEVSQLPNGQVKLRIQMEDFSPTWVNWRINNRVMMRGNRNIRLNNFALPGGGMPGDPFVGGKNPFTLYDDKGQAYEQKNPRDVLILGDWNKQDVTLSFAPPHRESRPEKLVFSCRRPVVIDIPFALKNVPLR